MEVDYYSKYLKYKSKYLELKAQLGSGKGACTTFKPELKRNCGCGAFQGRVDPKLSEEAKAKLVCKTFGCGHLYSAHGENVVGLDKATYKEMTGLK